MTGASVEAYVVVARAGFRLDASIRAETGEVVAVMGPSGAGKSTLLHALAGLARLTKGRIRIGERVVDDAGRRGAHVVPMRRGVVLLGQEPRLFPHLTAGENVAFALRTRGVARVVAKAEVDVWLDRVGLSGARDRRPDELSGGQQQRVALARALAATPRVVLLDEPFSSLDAETAADVRTVLAEQLSETGTTAIVVTHDAIDAVALADRLVLLEHGAVTQEDATRDVLARPGTRFAATVAGVDRLVGVARSGAWVHEASGVSLRPEDAASVGAVAHDGVAVAAIVPPSAVRVLQQGTAAASMGERAVADAWVARVVRLEATLGGVRVVTVPGDHGDDGVLELSAELPVGVVADLGLVSGATVALRIDSRQVRLVPA